MNVGIKVPKCVNFDDLVSAFKPYAVSVGHNSSDAIQVITDEEHLADVQDVAAEYKVEAHIMESEETLSNVCDY